MEVVAGVRAKGSRGAATTGVAAEAAAGAGGMAKGSIDAGAAGAGAAAVGAGAGAGAKGSTKPLSLPCAVRAAGKFDVDGSALAGMARAGGVVPCVVVVVVVVSRAKMSD